MYRRITRAGLLLACLSGLLFAQYPPQWWSLSGAIEHQPSARMNPAMAVNYGAGHVVLFGGSGPAGYLNDTWVWTGSDWEQRYPVPSPPPMSWARMVWDGRRNVLVGYSSDRYNPGPQTWVWDGSYWMSITGASLRIASGFSLAYDEVNKDLILFDNGDTWVYSVNDWQWLGGPNPPGSLFAVTPFTYPSPRTYASMTWDRARQKILLFSGLGSEWLTDTWVWTGRATGWQQITGASPPANWTGYQAAYFPLGGYLLAAGFPGGTATKIATWKWDGANWSSLDTQGPSINSGFSLSEDPVYGGILFFGGPTAETWGWGALPAPLNKTPIAKISAPDDVACTASTGAVVALDGSQSYDPDGQPIVSYQWTGPFGTAYGATASARLPIGLNTVTLSVSDGALSNSSSAGIRVTVGVEGLESPLGPLVLEPGPAVVPPTSFQSGRTLPLKLGLTCGATRLSSTDVKAPRLISIQPIGVPVSGPIDVPPPTSSTDSGGLFRSENTNWIYNLSTQDFAPGLYLLAIEMPDGLRYRTMISLR